MLIYLFILCLRLERINVTVSPRDAVNCFIIIIIF